MKRRQGMMGFRMVLEEPQADFHTRLEMAVVAVVTLERGMVS